MRKRFCNISIWGILCVIAGAILVFANIPLCFWLILAGILLILFGFFLCK